MAITPEGIVLVGGAEVQTFSSDFAIARLKEDDWVIVSADKGGPPTVKIFTNPAKNRPRITSPVGSDNPHAGFGGDGQTAMVTPTLLFSTNTT